MSHRPYTTFIAEPRTRSVPDLFQQMLLFLQTHMQLGMILIVALLLVFASFMLMGRAGARWYELRGYERLKARRPQSKR